MTERWCPILLKVTLSNHVGLWKILQLNFQVNFNINTNLCVTFGPTISCPLLQTETSETWLPDSWHTRKAGICVWCIYLKAPISLPPNSLGHMQAPGRVKGFPSPWMAWDEATTPYGLHGNLCDGNSYRLCYQLPSSDVDWMNITKL